MSVAVKIESNKDKLNIEIHDAFCDWEAMTVKFDSGRMLAAPGRPGVYIMSAKKAPTNKGLMSLLDLMKSKGIKSDELKKIEDGFKQLPIAIMNLHPTSKETLRLTADASDAVLDGLRRTGKAKWYAKDQQWKFTPKYREAVQTSLSAYSTRRVNQAYKDMPVFPWNKVSSKWGMCYPHQVEAARVCWERMRKGHHGAMILDEMGTGKTVSSLLSALALVKAGWAKHIICVIPPALLVKGENWRSDCENIFGILPKLPGLAKTKRRKSDVEPDESDISLYTYHSIRDSDVLAKACAEAVDGVVIFDEMQSASNRELETFNTCFILSQCANFSIGLTGTPVKNDLQEFWAQCAILDVAMFPFKDFENDYIEYEDKDVYVTGSSKRIAHGMPQKLTLQVPKVIKTMEKPLISRLAPMVIRRDRSEVMRSSLQVERADMYVEMRGSVELNTTAVICEVYSDWFEQAGELSESTMNDSIETLLGEMEKSRDPMQNAQMGELIMRLGRAADDPVGLLYPPEAELESKGELIAKRLRDKNVVSENPRYIPNKAKAIDRFIRKRPPNERYLVFCANVDTCEALAEWFTNNGIISAAITGKTSAAKRRDDRAAFKGDQVRLLFCTDVFSNGVNMGFADGVIHYSRPWTDAARDQREARVLRLDSTGVKRVISLTSGLYVDKRKEKLNLKKGRLGDMILNAARQNARSLASANTLF